MVVETNCQYAGLTRKALLGVCKARKAPAKGTKAVIVERLRALDTAAADDNADDGPPAGGAPPAAGTILSDALLTNGTAGGTHPAANALAGSLQGGGPLPAQTGSQDPPEGILLLSCVRFFGRASACCLSLCICFLDHFLRWRRVCRLRSPGGCARRFLRLPT